MYRRLLACACLATVISSIDGCSASSGTEGDGEETTGSSGRETSGTTSGRTGASSGASSGAAASGGSGRTGSASGTTGRTGAASGAIGRSGATSGGIGASGTTGAIGPSGRSGATVDGGTRDGSAASGGIGPVRSDVGVGDSRPPPTDAPRVDSGPKGAKFVGNITTNGAVRDGFAKYWNQITPENEGKWESVEPTRGNRNWSSLDRIYKFAQDNNIIFKHHVFVWGAQQPKWLDGLSASEQTAAVKDWMKAFCTRYPAAKYIDVVNEPPPHTTPSYKNGIGGDGASGWDWIVNSFKWAREACPNAGLILNDYNNIEYGNEHKHFVDIVKAVQKAGAPIDAIGAQAHDAFKIPTATVKSFIDGLAATGLPVYITEYDIGLADDAKQKAVMEEQFTMYYTHPNVEGITLWGYITGSTWRDNTGIQQPSGAMRPAMTWLMNYLGRPTN